MIKGFRVLTVLLLALLIAAYGLLAINYFNKSVRLQSVIVQKSTPLKNDITIVSWNIGYAGLGEESDFVMDGGENLLPPSKEIVEKNLAGISDILSKTPADIFLIQEISKPDMLNLGVDVLGGVRQALKDYSSWFSYDFRTISVPEKWSLKHGKAIFTTGKPIDVEIERLPNEPTRLGKVVQRQYHVQIAIYDEQQKWAFMNIHLSAFDDGSTRDAQLQALMELAKNYYNNGYHVVVGGDWNMQLVETNFPNNTKMEDLFWLKKLPKDKLLKDWQLVYDPKVPTVRTNYKPYVKGENYTTIIDGFLLSPNIDLLSVKTINTNFKFTDHQPVKIIVKTK